MKTGSPYAKIVPGSSGTTDIIFTQANVPPGTFNLERMGARINSKILLNSHNNDCFQRGIPQLADGIEAAAVWLRGAVRDLGGSYLRVIGISAGASAAIIFGHLLDADAVIAVAPEIALGIPRYRSHDWNPDKQYHPVYRDVTPLLAPLGGRLSVTMPSWDVSDFRQIQAVMRAPAVKLTMVPDVHSGARQLNWRRITEAGGAVDLGEMALNGTYHLVLSPADLQRGITAFEAIGKDDLFAGRVFSALHAIDPVNPGIAYRAAVQKALAGEDDQAAWLWRAAEPAIAETGLGLHGRYLEYRDWLNAAAFARLQAFAATVPAAPAPSGNRANMMAAW